MWGTTKRRHLPSNEKMPSHDVEEPHGDCLEAWTRDMTLEDLEDDNQQVADEEVWRHSKRWAWEDTATHDICRKDGYASLIKRLRAGPVVEAQKQYFGEDNQFMVELKRVVEPKAEVTQPNNVGQLPLHVACQNVR